VLSRRVATRWLLRVAFTVGVVAWILSGLHIDHLGEALAGVRLPWVGLAFVLYIAGQLVSAARWTLLGRSAGFQRPFRTYARYYFVGMFLNLFAPSTIGGDTARALYLAEGHRRGLALGSVLFDRASGLALLMGLGAVGVLIFGSYGLPVALTRTMLAVGIAIVAAWWTCPRLVRLLPEHHRLRRRVEHDLAGFWRDRRLLVRVAVLASTFHLMQVSTQWVLARAVGIALPFGYCLIMHPILSVMLALPVSVGGFGVREAGYLYFVGRFGFAPAIAVAMSLLWWAVTFLGGLTGGLVFVGSGMALPRLRAARPDAVSSARPPA
jgi:uncharacterized membrane protein YbhN (UPF0104 family)